MSYEETRDKEEYINELKDEINVIKRYETWELVDFPISCDAIRVTWIYKLKYILDGNIKKAQARLIAKRYAEHYRVDYFGKV